MTSKECEKPDHRVAIVCYDIAEHGASILIAVRSCPLEAADSGWQFLCGRDDDNVRPGKVWLIEEVLALDRSLGEFINLRPGTVLSRTTTADAWEVGYDPNEAGQQ